MPQIPPLETTQLVEPTLADSLCAAGRVPFLPANDPTVPAVLQSLGFAQVAPQGFLHPDNSWVLENQARFERGIGERRFARIPQPVAQYPSEPYSPEAHGAYAVAQLARRHTADSPALRNALIRAGFAPHREGFYAHPDSSWVAIVEGKPQAGFGTTFLTGWMKGETTESTATCPYNGSNAPSSWEEWIAHIAIAQLPWAGVRGGSCYGTQVSEGYDGRDYHGLTAAQKVSVLEYLGFTPQAANGATVWSHPDGSTITQRGDSFNDLTFDGITFGRFPFSAQQHWARSLRPRTEKWRAWCQDPVANPPPKKTLTGD